MGLRDKVAVLVNPAGGKTPSKLFVNSIEHALTAVSGLANYYTAAGLADHDFAVGRTYAVQVEFTDGTYWVDDRTVHAGRISFARVWVSEAMSMNPNDIVAAMNRIVAEGRFKLGFNGLLITELPNSAAYNAIANKDDNRFYAIRRT